MGSDIDFEKLRAEYARGVTYTELSKRYGLSYSTLAQKGRREDWNALREKTRQKVDNALSARIAKQTTARATRILAAADKLLDRLCSLLDDDETPLDPGAMRQCAAAIKDVRELYGVKNDLDREEQIARIKRLHREIDAMDNGESTITVKIDKPLEELSE